MVAEGFNDRIQQHKVIDSLPVCDQCGIFKYFHSYYILLCSEAVLHKKNYALKYYLTTSSNINTNTYVAQTMV